MFRDITSWSVFAVVITMLLVSSEWEAAKQHISTKVGKYYNGHKFSSKLNYSKGFKAQFYYMKFLLSNIENLRPSQHVSLS